jgi:hypothetical protein
MLSGTQPSEEDMKPKELNPHATGWDYLLGMSTAIAGIGMWLLSEETKIFEKLGNGDYIGAVAVMMHDQFVPIAGVAIALSWGIEVSLSQMDNPKFERGTLAVLLPLMGFLGLVGVLLPVLWVVDRLPIRITGEAVSNLVSPCLILVGIFFPALRTLQILRRWRSGKPA